MSRRSLGVVVISSLVLGGCVSVYHRPDLGLPDRFAHSTAYEAQPSLNEPWWRAVGDAGLDRLVARALASNRDLAVAALTVRRARRLAGLAELDQWPTASASIVGTRTGSVSSYSANLSVAYDVDLWRRLASTTTAARWEAQATSQDRDAARLALTGTACSLYWDIGFTHQQITTGEATLRDQQKIYKIVTTQHALGAISEVEAAEAQQAVSLQLTSLSALQQHLVEDRAAMTVLLGGGNLAPDAEPQDLTGGGAPDVRAGLPIQLLAQRPDLKAAEMRLRETLATGDATRASYYPDIVLTASGGGASSALGSLLAHPVGALMGAVSAPFLDFPRHRINNEVARMNYEIAVLGFKTTLFQALADTDNALSNRTELLHQEVSLSQTLTAATTAERLYGIRYRSGLVALRIWLEAQQSQRAAQLAMDSNRLAQLNNFGVLSLALGGGMSTPPTTQLPDIDARP